MYVESTSNETNVGISREGKNGIPGDPESWIPDFKLAASTEMDLTRKQSKSVDSGFYTMDSGC